MASLSQGKRRAGRPTVPRERMRTRLVVVKATPDEAARFKRLAELRCLTMSEVLRRYMRRFIADPNSCPDR